MPHSRLKYLLSLRMDVYCGNCSRVEDEEGSRRCRCKPPSPWPWSPCTCMVARSMLCHLLFPPSLNVTRTGECLSCAYTWSQSIASPSSPLIHQLLSREYYYYDTTTAIIIVLLPAIIVVASISATSTPTTYH